MLLLHLLLQRWCQPVLLLRLQRCWLLPLLLHRLHMHLWRWLPVRRWRCAVLLPLLLRRCRQLPRQRHLQLILRLRVGDEELCKRQLFRRQLCLLIST